MTQMAGSAMLDDLHGLRPARKHCPCAFSARHLNDLHISRTAKSSANHLLRTARPTFIKARVPNQDCQIVPTPIMTQFRARWTTRHIVAANLPQRCDVLQYPEF